ncbi:MAG: tRNA (uridine(34)/cytosine(34)/5-carboxymethylaminomethyluridine(34)-2'-O)-methyltransferase TrmL [Janthinobacterium lividum]
MFNVVLVHPEIPPNTGNVIRLCANTGAALHLIEPLGFPLDDARMRRAGLDYHEIASLHVHAGWDAFLKREQPEATRTFALTTKGSAPLGTQRFEAGDWFLFGSETSGLPPQLLETIAVGNRVRLPMRAGNRSLNLSNAVAVVVFEAWRQHAYSGGS